jgi:hypothetical protein
LSTVLVTQPYFEWVSSTDAQSATVPIREARYLDGVLGAAIQKFRKGTVLSTFIITITEEAKLVYTTLNRMEVRFCISLKDNVCQSSDHWITALLRLKGSLEPLLGKAYDESAVLR